MEMNSKIPLGEFIRKLRKGKGLSLAGVERITHISRSYLCKLENSLRCNPTMDIIFRLSKCFGIEVSTIAQFCEGGVNLDSMEVKDIEHLLLNERYLFYDMELTIEAKMSLLKVIKEMANYCVKKEISRGEGDRLMDLVDMLRKEILN